MKFRKPLLGAAVLALLGLGAWQGWLHYTTPALPDLPLDRADKEVAEAVDGAREEVRRHPRSGAAWGKLGMVLGANGFQEPAVVCFGHAERFDPDNPRWPYLSGVQMLLDGRSREG